MALTDKADSLELYSEQVRDTLSRPPSQAVRYGTGLVLAVVGLLVLMGRLIRYPDTLPGTIVITTSPTPSQVVVAQGGRLSRVYATEGMTTKPNQVLAELENTTRLENVPHLKIYTQQVRNYLTNPSGSAPSLANNLTFGDLQTDINVLAQQSKVYERLHHDSYLSERLQLLNKEIGYYNQLVALNQQQETINQAEYQNADKKYSIDKRLFTEKVYSQAEFLGYENTFLQKKKENEHYRKTLVENQLMLAGKEKERLELAQTHRQQVRDAGDAIRRAVQNCTNLLQNWQQTFLLETPVAGRVYFLKTLQAKQQVRPGDTLFTIIPHEHTLIGQAVISATNRGKLKVGQLVLIRLRDFPSEEYGLINGRVAIISLSPDNNLCRVSVRVPNPIKTTFGRSLPYSPQLPGTAEIVTEDLSLLERMLLGLRRLITR
ncbi:MAG: HlyD family efflux transporter periplasmic adaptor subunit [Rudanella sp.]|nr:HlyD family efflux transporter periplasmic adaptor subunit [Rudanella sp.]